jgi:hypothetical protein
MLPSRKIVQIVSAICFTLVCCVGAASADGGTVVPFYQDVFGHSSVWESIRDLFAAYSMLFTLIFCATVAVEFLVVFFLLGRPAKARRSLFIYMVLINIVTNPPAQISMLFVGDPDLLGSSKLAYLVDFLIELVVIAVEFGLLRWTFGRMRRGGVLDEPVTATRTFVIAVVANVASFAIGVVGLATLMMVLMKMGVLSK